MFLIHLSFLALTIFVYFTALGADSRPNYKVISNSVAHPVGELFQQALARRGIQVNQKALVFKNNGKIMHLAVQEYSFINALPSQPSEEGILFGHGWASNNASWVNYIEVALKDGVKPVTVIWPGHGMSYEPTEHGAFRSYIENARLGDYEPPKWIESVGRTLDDYMLTNFNTYTYWGHSMGDMIGSAMNHFGFLNPDFLVLMGGPNNFDNMGPKTRGLVGLFHGSSYLRQLTGLSNYDETLGRVPSSSQSLLYLAVKKFLSSVGIGSIIQFFPQAFAVGSFSRDYNNWFFRSMRKGYEWRGLTLKTNTLFVWGNKEQVPAISLEKTYDVRGKNIKWAEIELDGVDHFAELNKRSAEIAWRKYRDTFKKTDYLKCNVLF